jgi:hypothetical protein
MIVPLTQDNIFPGGVHHRLIVSNRVVELRRDSMVLEKEFEGSREVFFFVSHVGGGGLMVEMRNRNWIKPACAYATGSRG